MQIRHAQPLEVSLVKGNTTAALSLLQHIASSSLEARSTGAAAVLQHRFELLLYMCISDSLSQDLADLLFQVSYVLLPTSCFLRVLACLCTRECVVWESTLCVREC